MIWSIFISKQEKEVSLSFNFHHFLDDMELKIAGNADERSLMMPLLYVDDSEDTKPKIESDMINVLESFHNSEKSSQILNPANRMKPLDVVKVLMGIFSSRESVTRFKYDGVYWGKLLEYDYEQLMNVAEETVNAFYVNALAQNESKRRKLNEWVSNLTQIW